MGKIGMVVSKLELDSIRDEANHRMLDTVISELDHDVVLYEAIKNPRLQKKIKLMQKLVKRIKEESNINVETKQIEDISLIKSSA